MVTDLASFYLQGLGCYLGVLYECIYQVGCGPLGCGVGRVVSDNGEGLMDKMWREVQVAISGMEEVLVVVVKTKRGVEYVVEVLGGKQSCNVVHGAAKTAWRGH